MTTFQVVQKSFDDVLAESMGGCRQIVYVDVSREETAEESLRAFFKAVTVMHTPGIEMEGMITPIDGALLRMRNVGVVLRHPSGKRARTPNPTELPTIYYSTKNTGRLIATFGKHVAEAQVKVFLEPPRQESIVL